jgi:hypothetical protein
VGCNTELYQRVWQTLLEALNDSGEGNSSLQMIDSCLVPAFDGSGLV